MAENESDIVKALHNRLLDRTSRHSKAWISDAHDQVDVSDINQDYPRDSISKILEAAYKRQKLLN